MAPARPAPSAAVAAFLLLVAVLSAADILGDLHQGMAKTHLALEAAVVLVGLVGAVWLGVRSVRLWREARLAAEEYRKLSGTLAVARTDAERWRTEAERWRAEASGFAAGLGAAIDKQLEAWGLTAAEKEIALLLLKGLSHKELASLRGTSEATVRQQARALYKKAGLSGRADLAAFFLEDLLGPQKQPPAA